jgi:uncharacterized repeat protein (TIGR01451 family)
MKKILLYSVMALALVLGLILPMAVPVMASDIEGSKHRDPDEAPYAVGETIYYVMTVTNPEGNTATNTLTRIWDTLPDDTVIEFLYAGSPYGTQLVQNPGDTTTFYASYTVRAADFERIDPPGPLDPYWGVRNTFRAEGLVGGEVPKEVLVEDVAEVIPPEPVGGEAFPVGKLSILAPWIALGAAIIAGAGIFVRRRQARS